MERIAIIPARGGSKRILSKNIKNFYGKPIIAYSIESGCFDKIIVSTDDLDNEKLEDWHLQVNESKDDSTVDTPFSANAKLAESLDIKNTPTLILVNSKGVMIDRHIGPLTESSDIEAFWAKSA